MGIGINVEIDVAQKVKEIDLLTQELSLTLHRLHLPHAIFYQVAAVHRRL